MRVRKVRLEKNNRCAFEVAPNDPPYRGVRGKAVATLTREGASDVLDHLIERYLGSTNTSLANWLRSRVDEEYVIELQPHTISSWDYGGRMDSA